MSKEYRIFKGPPASQEFIDALQGGGGSTSMECGFCGRTHYAIASDFVEPSWIENAKEHKEIVPHGVVLRLEGDSVGGHDIDGVTIVDGCECNGLARYEALIWNERHMIARYLKAKAEAMAKEAAKLVEGLPAS